jgi:hypothetical protein
MSAKESHKSDASSTGYSSFYVNPAINDDLVKINLGGTYEYAGLSFALYSRIKTGIPEYTLFHPVAEPEV